MIIIFLATYIRYKKIFFLMIKVLYLTSNKVKQMEKEKDYKFYNGRLELNTKVWMRPIQAIKYFKRKGIIVTPQTIRYWCISGKIECKKIIALDSLLVVNVKTSPFGDLEK